MSRQAHDGRKPTDGSQERAAECAHLQEGSNRTSVQAWAMRVVRKLLVKLLFPLWGPLGVAVGEWGRSALRPQEGGHILLQVEGRRDAGHGHSIGCSIRCKASVLYTRLIGQQAVCGPGDGTEHAKDDPAHCRMVCWCHRWIAHVCEHQERPRSFAGRRLDARMLTCVTNHAWMNAGLHVRAVCPGLCGSNAGLRMSGKSVMHEMTQVGLLPQSTLTRVSSMRAMQGLVPPADRQASRHNSTHIDLLTLCEVSSHVSCCAGPLRRGRQATRQDSRQLYRHTILRLSPALHGREDPTDISPCAVHVCALHDR